MLALNPKETVKSNVLNTFIYKLTRVWFERIRLLRFRGAQPPKFQICATDPTPRKN